MSGDCIVCAPGEREASEHVYYGSTKSLCAECKRTVEAKVLFRSERVWLEKFCPEHGHQECMISSSVDWYLDSLEFLAPEQLLRTELRPVQEGCPHDCGPCVAHRQRVVLPVIPITSACNLDCPICYTVNRNEDAFMLSPEAFSGILEALKAADDELDIINFTGGEPTLHPELPELLRLAREAGIQRLTISTNGLKLKDEALLLALAEHDARIVLSLDTLDPAIDRQLLGANTVKTKLELLDSLERHDVTTTILPAVAAGLNDEDVPKLFDLMLERPNICSLELHTLSFTGQGGVDFDRGARISVPDLHRILEDSTDGKICARDFVPSPLAHPHCYSICYLLMLDGGGYLPFTRFMSRERLYDLLGDSLYIEPHAKAEEVLGEALDELWADPDPIPEAQAVMATLKRLLREMFPSPALPLRERQHIAERLTKAIYIHSHMDEESFDVARIMKCGIGVPEADGSNIPTCAYNVLYREKDPRFAHAGADLLAMSSLVREAST